MEGFKKYRIWKGWHWCAILFRIKALWKCTRMVQRVIFKDSCKYDIPFPDKLDINKLFGFSYGNHHQNSARFGWNCAGGGIALFAYTYLNGKRAEKFITLVETEKEYKLMISVNKDKYIFTVFNGDKSKIEQVTIPKPKNTPNLGWKLWPYFGGNQKAPHDMTILMGEEN